MRQKYESLTPTLLVLLAGILWSFSGVLIKAIHWNFICVTGMRSLIGGLIQFSFLVFANMRVNACDSGKQLTPVVVSSNVDDRRLASVMKTAVARLFAPSRAHFVGAALFVINMLALAWAFRISNANNAVFLHYSGVVLVALLSYSILRQRLSRHDWYAVAAAAFGIFLFCVDGLQLNNPLSTILGIICGLTLAGTQLALGVRSQNSTDPWAALETIILGNLVMFVFSLPFIVTHLNPLPSSSDWILILLLGIVPWGLPDSIYAVAIRKVPIFRALILGLSDPILTAVWPLLFMHEYPTILGVLGSIIVLLAIVYQAFASTKGRSSAETTGPVVV